MSWRVQSIALWFHIPLWVAAAVVVVVSGAYYAGKESHEEQKRVEIQDSFIKVITLKQLSEISVSKI